MTMLAETMKHLNALGSDPCEVCGWNRKLTNSDTVHECFFDDAVEHIGALYVPALVKAIEAEIEEWGGSWYDRTPEDLAKALIDRAVLLVEEPEARTT